MANTAPNTKTVTKAGMKKPIKRKPKKSAKNVANQAITILGSKNIIRTTSKLLYRLEVFAGVLAYELLRLIGVLHLALNLCFQQRFF